MKAHELVKKLLDLPDLEAEVITSEDFFAMGATHQEERSKNLELQREITRLTAENAQLREALEVVNDYFKWEIEAWKNSWCQDGSKRMFAQQSVIEALKENTK